jgi:hypothetical protein
MANELSSVTSPGQMEHRLVHQGKIRSAVSGSGARGHDPSELKVYNVNGPDKNQAAIAP